MPIVKRLRKKAAVVDSPSRRRRAVLRVAQAQQTGATGARTEEAVASLTEDETWPVRSGVKSFFLLQCLACSTTPHASSTMSALVFRAFEFDTSLTTLWQQGLAFRFLCC